MITTEGTMPDARCGILLLILANIVAFTQKSIVIELSFIIFLSLVLIMYGCLKQAIKWIILWAIIVLIQDNIIPIIGNSLLAGFSAAFSIFRKMIPCVLIGSLFIYKIHLQYVIIALRKWHVPQQILIPLSVSIRYIPSIKEEFHFIKDSLKLRNISWENYAGCIISTLIINAANTSDELSAAAITRGIENPCKKTTLLELKYHLLDYITTLIGLCFAVISVVYGGGAL